MTLSITTTPMPENKWGLRHAIAIMGLGASALAYIHRFCLSLAITEMVKYHPKDQIDPHSCPFPQNTTTIIQYTGEFEWDEKTQGLILSSFFWSYVIMVIPGGLMVERWGVKWVLGYSMLVSSVGTLITPIVSRTFGSWGLICLRLIIGIGQGPRYPALSTMMSNWTSTNQRGLFSAIVFGGVYVGTFLSMALSGLIIYSFDWTAVFYFFGGIGIAWLIVWLIVYYNTPLEHPFIKQEERTHIINTSGKRCYKDLPPTPWIPILKSVPLWGLVISQIGHDWGLFTVITEQPKYMKSVLHILVEENGAFSGLPHLCMWFISIFTGWAIDLIIVKFRWSVSLLRKICITIGGVVPAVGMIAASYSGCDKTLVTFFLVIGMTMMGAYIPAAKANILDLSPNYAGTINALAGTVGSMTGIFTPYLTGVLTPNSTLLEWRVVFWISFAVIIGSNIAFLIMGTARTQWWNDPDQVRSYINRKENRNEETT